MVNKENIIEIKSFLTSDMAMFRNSNPNEKFMWDDKLGRLYIYQEEVLDQIILDVTRIKI